MALKVRDTMTQNPRSIDASTSVVEAAQLMREGHIGSLPITADEQLVGMITDRDIAMRVVAEAADHTNTSVGDSVTPQAIGPGRGPRHLSRNESRRMNLNDDIVDRRLRLGPLHQRHPGRSRSLIRHHDRLHRPPPCVELPLAHWDTDVPMISRNPRPGIAPPLRPPCVKTADSSGFWRTETRFVEAI